MMKIHLVCVGGSLCVSVDFYFLIFNIWLRPPLVLQLFGLDRLSPVLHTVSWLQIVQGAATISGGSWRPFWSRASLLCFLAPLGLCLTCFLAPAVQKANPKGLAAPCSLLLVLLVARSLSSPSSPLACLMQSILATCIGRLQASSLPFLSLRSSHIPLGSS